jgi:glycosyltransferase involved in cell wall biosynthesis
MKKILLYWNGMASHQVSGGDIYVKKFIDNINHPVDVVVSGKAYEMLVEDSETAKRATIIDRKVANNLFSLLLLYTVRLVKASYVTLRRRNSYDLVVSTSPFMYDIIPAVMSRADKKVVIMFHILPERKGRGFVTKLRFLLASVEQRISLIVIQKYFDVVLVGNEDLRQLMSDRFPDKEILVAHAGIDTSKIDSSPDVKKVDNLALFVGRLTHQKGVFDLLDVAEYMQSKHSDFRLVVVGDGPDKNRFTEAAKSRSISSIEAVGFVSEEEKYKLMKEAKFFIFPSYEEGWGIALAEALYADCIAVCYEIKHYKSLFSEYPHYVNIGDIDALKYSLEEAYGTEVKDSQKEYISQYDDNVVVEKVIKEIMR